jgi:hypothetical protein
MNSEGLVANRTQCRTPDWFEVRGYKGLCLN